MSDGNGELPLIVKVGGSLLKSARLQRVLDLIAAATRPVVIVPGGGPFADSVRALQMTLRFDDAMAHRLALLAMHQMAKLIAARGDRFVLAEDDHAVDAALAGRRIPVAALLSDWSADQSLPADWSVSSDSIAARLAERFGGAPLVLVKSLDAAGESAVSLSARGIVDGHFPGIIERAGLDWRAIGPADDVLLAAILSH